MKIIYLSLAILFYIIGVIIGYIKKVNGDQSLVSMREAKYPLLTSLNPFNQPIGILLLISSFLWLYSKEH